jgi:ubiquinone/menaquinone biosynthesis C-methylase UbiE
MADVPARLQQLSPERRRLVEQLLRDRSRADDAPSPTRPADAWHMPQAAARGLDTGGLRLESGGSSLETKRNFRQFYNEVSRQLDASQFGQFSYFLNYGYVADGVSDGSVVTLPENYFNRNSVRLVLELVGDCDLRGRRVLDVGCGRGGTVYTLEQFFQPQTVVGVDLSPNAIEFCRRVHRYAGVSFREGDSERLPFDDGSFDVVTNIESSHSYPDIRAFYLEAWRLLTANGDFLYTDVLPRGKSDECRGLLEQIGFTVVRARDTTANVLASCDQVASSRARVFETGNDARLVKNFLAAPGSQVYEGMKSGAWVYRLLALRKPAPPAV